MMLSNATESLLKYEIPVSCENTKVPGHVSEEQKYDVPNCIFPPREFIDDRRLWVQKVSTNPCTRREVVQLHLELDNKLQEKQARLDGICPIRRELYSQFFDELIRQVTINCDSHGLLLAKVRDEIHMTLATYQTLYESSMAFGVRKQLLAEHVMDDHEKQVAALEKEKEELMKQPNEEKARSEEVKKREAELRQTEERKLIEENDFLKRTNNQLKQQLKLIYGA